MGAAAVAPEGLDAGGPADPLVALARRADPADAGAQNNLGVVLARHGRAADAHRAFARALALDPGMVLARRNLAASADPDADAAAERALRARVRAAEGDAEAWRALVRHLTVRGRHDAARDALARWAAAAPGHDAPATERARAELAAGRPDDALAALAEARTRAPAAAGAALDVLAARAVYQQGDAPAALALLDRAHAAAPNDAEAALLRSFVLGELGADAGATAARERAAALNPALGRADGNLAVARAAAAAAPNAPAAADAAADRPTADGALALARALRVKGYVAEAATALGRARGTHPDDPALAREAGEVLLLAGRPDDAVAAWEAVLAQRDNDPAGWLNLGVARALARGDGRDARSAFERAAALARGTCAAAWALAGVAHEARAAGHLAEATDTLRAAASAAREASAMPRAVLAASLARLLAAAGRGGEAARAAAAAERLAPGWAYAATVHGQVLAAAGRHAEARQAFGRAVALAPDDAAARYGLAFAASACGDHAAARAETERALALAPVVPTLPWLLVADVGELCICGLDAAPIAARGARPFSARDVSSADARLLALFGHDAPHAARPPGDADPAIVPACAFADVDALLAVGEYDRAVGALSRALARGAPRGAALARAGLAFERQGFFGEALERYGQALEPAAPRVATPDHDAAPAPNADVPDAADPRRGRARMLVALGRWSQAVEAAADAVDHAPNDPRTHALAARASAMQGDDAEATASATAAERLAAAGDGTGDVAESWRAVADAWRAVDDVEREAEAWASAVAAGADDPRVALNYADALVRAARRADARALLERVVRDQPGASDAALALGRLCADAGDAGKAARLFADVAARDVWHGEALARLALALVEGGQWDEGARSAERALRLDRDHALGHAAAAAVARAEGLAARAASHARRAIMLEPAGEAARRARSLLADLAVGGVACARG